MTEKDKKDGNFSSQISGNKKTVLEVLNISLRTIPDGAWISLSVKVRWKAQTKLSAKQEIENK